jgi:hypothetical protein
VYDNIIYIKDFSIKNEFQNLRGDIEFPIFGDKNYFAGRLWIDNVDVKMAENGDASTMKEKLIWLGGIKNNVFLSLKIDNLSVGNVSGATFDGDARYGYNLLDFYNIRELNFKNLKKLAGKFAVGIRLSKPFIEASLGAESANVEIDLLDYIININKYKNLILDENLEESPNFWINRFFNLPNWKDISGKIDFSMNKLTINSKELANISLASDVDDGVFNIKNLSFFGLGGKTEISGKADLREIKSIELRLTDTIYNIKDVLQMALNSDADVVNGAVGMSFIFRAQGYNKNVFLSSMALESKFTGQNLYIKALGLSDLRNRLNSSFENSDILNGLAAEDVILNNSGTTFKTFSGNLLILKNIIALNSEAFGDGYSNKLAIKIDNSKNKTVFNFNNISSLVVKVGKEAVPLYLGINFLENLNGRANMTIDAAQINQYIDLLKEEFKKQIP